MIALEEKLYKLVFMLLKKILAFKAGYRKREIEMRNIVEIKEVLKQLIKREILVVSTFKLLKEKSMVFRTEWCWKKQR